MTDERKRGGEWGVGEGIGRGREEEGEKRGQEKEEESEEESEEERERHDSKTYNNCCSSSRTQSQSQCTFVSYLPHGLVH